MKSWHPQSFFEKVLCYLAWRIPLHAHVYGIAGGTPNIDHMPPPRAHNRTASAPLSSRRNTFVMHTYVVGHIRWAHHDHIMITLHVHVNVHVNVHVLQGCAYTPRRIHRRHTVIMDIARVRTSRYASVNVLYCFVCIYLSGVM